MSTKNTFRVVAVIAALFIVASSFAQSNYDGDNFISFLGKGAESPELKDLKTTYKLEMANETHYLSKDGVELLLKGGSLNEINLYKNSNIYGSFKGNLPKGLTFGMASGSVKAKLGKPTVAYNSGYCEFDLPNCTISCWFEGGALAQVAISSK
ncbi:MAG: hypothetical protein JWO06_699 [Bacteroidota bacterium]|nr:hypothetical protein [Bacteroidota bacterium]